MRSINKPKERTPNLKDLSPLSASSPSKSFERGSPTSKSFSVVSKYSMFKSVHQQKLLAKKLEDHGPSLVYNFKYRDIMEGALQVPKEDTSCRLPTINISESPISRRIDSAMRVSGGFGTQYEKQETGGANTNMLKSRVFEFLKTEGDGGSQKALDTFESEIISYKEKHREQREHVYKVLNVTEMEQMNQRMKDLTLQNVKKYLPKNRNIEPPGELISPRSPAYSNNKLRSPQSPSTKIRFKFTTNELSTASSPQLIKSSIATINPSPINASVRPSSTMRSASKVENGLSSPLANMNSVQLSQMLETSRKILDTKLSAYKVEPVINLERTVEISTPTVNSANSPVSKVWNRMRLQKSMRMVHPAYNKFVDIVKRLVKKMDLLNLTIKQIQQHKIFPSGPYEREGSAALIKNVKIGDLVAVNKQLEENRYLVYDYDPMKQTALHWAIKRGHGKVAKLLLDNGADPDARDMSGRSPLFFAAKCNSIPCIKLLLLYRANPMIKSFGSKMPIDFATNEMARFIIRKAYRVQLILELCSPKKYKALWDKIDKRDFELRDSELE